MKDSAPPALPASELEALRVVEQAHAFFSEWPHGFSAGMLAERAPSQPSAQRLTVSLRRLVTRGLLSRADGRELLFFEETGVVQASSGGRAVRRYSITASGVSALRAAGLLAPLRCPTVEHPIGSRMGGRPLVDEGVAARSACHRARLALYRVSEQLCPGFHARPVAGRLLALTAAPQGTLDDLTDAVGAVLTGGFLPDGVGMTSASWLGALGSPPAAGSLADRIDASLQILCACAAGTVDVESERAQLALARLDADLSTVAACAEREVLSDPDVMMGQTIDLFGVLAGAMAGALDHRDSGRALREALARGENPAALAGGAPGRARAAGRAGAQLAARLGLRAGDEDAVALHVAPCQFTLTAPPIITLPFTGTLGGQVRSDAGLAHIAGPFTVDELTQLTGMLAACVDAPITLQVTSADDEHEGPRPLTFG